MGVMGCLYLCLNGSLPPGKPVLSLKRREENPGLSWRGWRQGGALWFDDFEAWLIHLASAARWLKSLGPGVGIIKLKSQFLNLTGCVALG